MYDARLGRRWNVDPIYKPWESPYAAFANNPVYFSDPFGLDAEPSPKEGEPEGGGKGEPAPKDPPAPTGKPKGGNGGPGSPSAKQKGNIKTVQGTIVTVKRKHEFEFQLTGIPVQPPRNQRDPGTPTVGDDAPRGRDLSQAPLEVRIEEWVRDWLSDNGVGTAEKTFEKDAGPVMQFVADLNPIMSGMHIIKGIQTGKDAYENTMGAADYLLHAASFVPIGGVSKVFTKTVGKFKGINQLNKLVKTGKAPKTIKRFDKAKIFGEIDHVHFDNGAALNRDGTWKHGFKSLTNSEKGFLLENGWILPK